MLFKLQKIRRDTESEQGRFYGFQSPIVKNNIINYSSNPTPDNFTITTSL